MLHQVALLTGSNHSEKERLLQHARQVVERRIGRVVAQSKLHYSEAWGFRSEQEFANQALLVETELQPLEVLHEVLEGEREVGRDRTTEEQERQQTGQRYASRVIDIDVIFYDDVVWQSPTLTLPHPLVMEREFALIPLREVAPTWVKEREEERKI